MTITLLLLLMTDGRTERGIHYLELSTKIEGRKLLIDATPRQYLRFKTIDDTTLALSPETLALLDGPILATVSVLAELDQMESRPLLPIYTSFYFELAVRELSGEAFDRNEMIISLGLADKKGHILITAGKKKRTVPIIELGKQEGYLKFLAELVFFEPILMKKPKDDNYLVDLYYMCSHLAEGISERFTLVKTPGLQTIMERVHLYGIREQLGVTLHREGLAQEALSQHTAWVGEGLETYCRILKETEPDMDALALLADRFPAEPRAVRLLAEAHLRNGQAETARRLLQRLRPLFAEDNTLGKLYDKAELESTAWRRELLAVKDEFELDEEHPPLIIAPISGDLIGGQINMIFDPGSKGDDLILAELYANDRLIETIPGPPFRIEFKPPGRGTRLRLDLKTYYRDKTIGEARVRVRTISLNEEQRIQLIRLRAVATRGANRFLTDLEAENFSISEESVPRRIAFFEKDVAPLHIALLIDTSRSMSGDKLYRAQHAARTLLTNMEDSDQASVLLFDDKVLRLGDFGTEMEEIEPVLGTLHPRLGTSLNDAIGVAADALFDKSGNRVIIIISDGKDTASRLKSDAVFNLLEQSDIMVYSLFLGSPKSSDREGFDFLTKLSQATGSITKHLDDSRYLEGELSKIYRELKSFYLLDFYSTRMPFDQELLKVRVNSGSARVRFRHLTKQSGKMRSR